MKCYVKLLFSLLAFLTMSSALAAPVFGRFVGTFKNDLLRREQLAKIDFVTYQNDESQLEMRAVLTLQFGSFSSGEYASYHFDHVRYNLLTSALVFDQADQDITFIVRSFNGTSLKGELRSALTGSIGSLSLSSEGTANFSSAGTEALQGQYRGMCEGKENVLQIFTSRSGRDTNRTGNPFPYDIFAQRAVVDPLFCSRDDNTGAPDACVESSYTTGSYQFFTGKLDLFGIPDSVSCEVQGNTIQCGSCRYQREKGFTLSSGGRYSPPKARPFWESSGGNSGPLTALSGDYFGYVHHEYSNTYQSMGLSVMSFQDPMASGGSLRLSAVARLFFGDQNSSESLTYRFNERSFPVGTPITSLVFFRPEADVDATLQITKLTANEVQGVWTSLIFGRVGTFVVRKNSTLSLPQGTARISKVSNPYLDSNFDLNVLVRLGDAPVNSENPFAPLQFGGFVRMREGGANDPVTEGTYDFFTGKISFKYGNDSTRIMSGWRDKNGLRLTKPSNGWNTRMQPFDPIGYSIRR